MLDLLGRGYVIDSIVASYHRHQKEEVFRQYVADGLYALVTRQITYGCMYSDIIGRKNKDGEITAEEARDKIRRKLRGDKP